MTIRELGVLYALNSLLAGEGLGFSPVPAREVTDYIRRGFRHEGQDHIGINDGPLFGLKWKPAPHEVIRILTDLRGANGQRSFSRQPKNRLVFGVGRPLRYGLTKRGVDALCM